MPITTGHVDIESELTATSGSVEQDSIRINNQSYPAAYRVFDLLADAASVLVYGSDELRYVDLISGQEESIDIDIPETGILSVFVDASDQRAYYVTRHVEEYWDSDYFSPQAGRGWGAPGRRARAGGTLEAETAENSNH